MSEVSTLKTIEFKEKRTHIDLFSAFLRARKQFGGGKVALIDGDGRKLTYTDITRAAFALGAALKKGSKSGETVGIMLPTGAGAIIAFYAVLAYGRIPAMINFTAGSRNINSWMSILILSIWKMFRQTFHLGTNSSPQWGRSCRAYSVQRRTITKPVLYSLPLAQKASRKALSLATRTYWRTQIRCALTLR